MDSTLFQAASPTILIVEDDAELRDLIAVTLRQAGYDVVLAPDGSAEAALDLISALEFDGLCCEARLPGPVDGWEVGTTFSFVSPHKLTVYASAALSEPPGRLRNGIFLRKPFALERLVRIFDAGTAAARARRLWA
ncbi:response regulator transcription factor [Microvirga roseola]|uniref:response regulator transcription factor n=1 Tax=Microvirga roseola TaxID=2883126 RepID=UPI001E43249D|nr:response regulator [Microvirga roseola]